jgi:hypothetical protein
MPLIEGKSPKSFTKNLKTEVRSGKPLKQSLAIAYSLKRKAKEKEMFEGGPVDSYNEDQEKMPLKESYDRTEKESDYQEPPDRDAPYNRSMMSKPFAKGGMIQKDEKKTGYLDMPQESPLYNEAAMREDDKRLNQHGRTETTPEMGPPPMNHDDEFEEDLYKLNQEGEQDPGGSIPYAFLAEGGIVDRIMNKRALGQMMPVKLSEGGRIANVTPIRAGFEPNEYDDLVLRDDLESSYGDDDNAGDSLDNERQNMDRQDIVERIMRQRAMRRNRNPVPA